jgi:hypothetical protein
MKQPRSNYAAVAIRASEFPSVGIFRRYEAFSTLRFRGIPIGLQYRRTYQIEGLSVEIADRSTVDYRVNIAMTSSYNGSFSSTEHEIRWNIIKSIIRDNLVIIVTRMRAILSWNPERGKTYCLHQNIQTLGPTHPLIQRVLWETDALSRG